MLTFALIPVSPDLIFQGHEKVIPNIGTRKDSAYAIKTATLWS